MSDAHVFGMGPIGDDAIAGREPFDPRACLDDNAGLTIADRDWRLQLGAYGLERWTDPVGAHLVDDLPYLLRLAARLFQPIRAPEVDEHALGTGGHHARTRFDHERNAGGRGHGSVHELRGAIRKR